MLNDVLGKVLLYTDEQREFNAWLSDKEEVLAEMRLVHLSDPETVLAQVKKLKVGDYNSFFSAGNAIVLMSLRRR